MKKLLKTTALSALVLALFAGCSSPASEGSKSSKKTEGVKEGSVVIVDQVDIKGNFYNGFGNTSEDNQIKVILHQKASSTIYDDKGNFVINSGYTESIDSELDAEGNKTFTIKIKPDLKFNDGSALTAYDYAFAVLFDSSEAYASVGASALNETPFVGQEAYQTGVEFDKLEDYKKEIAGLDAEKDLEKIKAAKEKYKSEDPNGFFKGLEVVDETTYKVTVKKENLPYFYELAWLMLSPLPIEHLAPGAKVETVEGKGTHVTGVSLKEIAEKFITAEGYLHNPVVSAGSYSFVSFKNGEVILKANPYYPGDFEGNKPQIETVISKANSNAKLEADRLLNGDVDIVGYVNMKETIDKLNEADGIGVNRYNRLGYGYLAFAYSDSVTSDVNVRKAMAHLVDRQALISSFLGAGNGIVSNGDYGTAQWMYIDNQDALNKDLNTYDFSIEDANKYLDNTDYKFQKDGKTAWTVESGLRHNSKGEALVVKHFGTENNPVSEFLQTNIIENGKKVGLDFQVTLGDWNALIEQFYYRSQLPLNERYSTFNLAVGFTPVYDPYLTYHSNLAGTDKNPLEVRDEKYDEISEKMRLLSSDDTEEFSKLWLEFQKNFNDKLPLLPLYANVYNDFYNNKKIENLPTTPFYNWAWVLERINLK